MKAVILAGGLGTRLSEETALKPKPMVELGGQPILWHIMKIYAAHNITEFIVCCGYKGHLIKDYFYNYCLHKSNVSFDLRNNQMQMHDGEVEPWNVTLVDTGEETMTGGRLKRAREYLDSETFCLTYGDGVSNVDISELINFHRQQNTIATLTAVKPPGRFGVITLHAGENIVTDFSEKTDDGGYINGGFFVLEPEVMDYIEGDHISFEKQPLNRLSEEKRLAAYRHHGFWQPMDTLRDKTYLERLWREGQAPWKIWRE